MISNVCLEISRTGVFCVCLLLSHLHVHHAAVIDRAETRITVSTSSSLEIEAVSLPSSTEPLFNCQGVDDGTYPDYQRACRIFFLCQTGHLRVFWCMNSTVFNPESGHCDLPSKVRCVNPDRRGWLPLAGECLDLEDGVYVDYASGCRDFYFCSGGVKTSFTCPEKTLFDWQTGFCRPTQHVSCGLLSCERKKDGFHVDFRSGCKRYYLCNDSRKTEFVCPRGTVFNWRLSQCTEPKGVRCRGEDVFNCHGLPDGYYPDHHAGCRVFYQCHNGKAKSFSCPGTSIFNRNTLSCDEPWKTRCERPSSSSSDCTTRPDGIYAKYDTNCREFVVCRRGLVHQTGACASHKAFSPVTGLCQPEAMVTCASVKDPDCDSRRDGMYPDSGTGCAAFYVCLNGRRVLTSYCASKTLYDVATGTCLPSPLVTCNATATLDLSLAKLSSYDCRGRVGLYPDLGGNCKGYFVCAFGHQVRVDCPLGSFFNVGSQRCEESATCAVPVSLGSFRCLSGDEGIYPTSNCERWHECWDQVGTTFACPTSMAFDTRSKMCLPRTTARCGESNEVNWSAGNTTRYQDADFDCAGRQNGLHAPAEDCGSFHICADGQTVSSKCPAGFHFDQQQSRCAPAPPNSPCYPEPKVTTDTWSAFTEEFVCDGKPNGMYPDFNSQCTRYVVCENGRQTVVYCPDGEKFNKLNMVCQKEQSVTCGTTRSTSTTPSYQIERAKLNDSPNSLSSSFGCPTGDTGFFADFSSNCRNFHVCFNGVRRTYACPNSLLFNPSNRICDLPTNVICQDQEPTEKVTYNCSAGGDDIRQGLYPDYPNGCASYYACSEEGNAIVYTCPPGKLFDFRTQSCDLSEKVTCQDIEGNASLVFYHAHGVPKRFVFNCLDKSDGFYPDYARHCHVFYRCVRGKKVSHYCKPGLLFNPKIGICDFEDNVVCAPVN